MPSVPQPPRLHLPAILAVAGHRGIGFSGSERGNYLFLLMRFVAACANMGRISAEGPAVNAAPAVAIPAASPDPARLGRGGAG